MNKRAIIAAAIAAAAAMGVAAADAAAAKPAPVPAAKPADGERERIAILDMLNSRAAGNAVRYEESAKIVAEAARAGDPLHMFVLGVCGRDSKSPPAAVAAIPAAERERMLAEAKPVLERLAKRKNPFALYLLAVESKNQAMLEEAAERGNPQALNRVAAALVKATPVPFPECETHPELARACAMFKRAAATRDMNGLYNLGVCLNSGIGTKRDPEAAFNAFRTAAELGHVDAMNNLGICFREGIHATQNLETSAYWFRKAAEAGSPVGMLNYGWALRKGEGVKKNLKAAALMIYKAARLENPDALNAWGLMILNGEGIADEPGAAVRFFEKAAGLGCVQAMRNLRICYEEGRGVKKSAAKALLWKMRADAACGDKFAADWLKDNEEANENEE